jgi:hypothetical protein
MGAGGLAVAAHLAELRKRSRTVAVLRAGSLIGHAFAFRRAPVATPDAKHVVDTDVRDAFAQLRIPVISLNAENVVNAGAAVRPHAGVCRESARDPGIAVPGCPSGSGVLFKVVQDLLKRATAPHHKTES